MMDTLTVKIVCAAALLAVFAYYAYERLTASDCGDEDCTVGCVGRRRLSTFMMFVTVVALAFLLTACEHGKKKALSVDSRARCVPIYSDTTYYCIVNGQGMLCDGDKCLPLMATPLPEAPP